MYEEIINFVRIMARLGLIFFGIKLLVALIRKNGETKFYSLLMFICFLITIRIEDYLPPAIRLIVAFLGTTGFVFFGINGIIAFYKKDRVYRKYLIFIFISIFLISLHYQ